MAKFRFKPITAAQALAIAQLTREGQSLREIMALVGVAESTVSKYRRLSRRHELEQEPITDLAAAVTAERGIRIVDEDEDLVPPVVSPVVVVSSPRAGFALGRWPPHKGDRADDVAAQAQEVVVDIAAAARCEPSPTGAHHWVVDSNLIGACRYCASRRQYTRAGGLTG